MKVELLVYSIHKIISSQSTSHQLSSVLDVIDLSRPVDSAKEILSSVGPQISEPIVKSAPLSGKLTVKLVGCKDLIGELPTRPRTVRANSENSKTIANALMHRQSNHPASGGRSSNAGPTNEVKAVLRLDSQGAMIETPYKLIGEHCWDHKASLEELDRAKEFEISIYRRDNYLVGWCFLRVEDFATHIWPPPSQLSTVIPIELHPQGVLYAEICFTSAYLSSGPSGNATTGRAKLKRQRLFTIQKGKQMVRPQNLNIDVAAWLRLMFGKQQQQHESKDGTKTTVTNDGVAESSSSLNALMSSMNLSTTTPSSKAPPANGSGGRQSQFYFPVPSTPLSASNGSRTSTDTPQQQAPPKPHSADAHGSKKEKVVKSFWYVSLSFCFPPFVLFFNFCMLSFLLVPNSCLALEINICSRTGIYIVSHPINAPDEPLNVLKPSQK